MKTATVAPAARASVPQRCVIAAAMVVVALGCVAWWGVWNGPFLFDDEVAIVENSALLAGDWWDAAFGERHNPLANRPLPCATLVLDFVMFGFGPFGPHVTNLLLHLANAVLLFVAARRALLAPNLAGRFDGPRAARLAAAIASVWVVHPLGGDSVAYVTQRSTLLGTAGLLLALYAVLRAHGSLRCRAWRAVAVGALACAMASKEDFVVAPLLVVLFERAFVLPSWSSLRGRLGWHAALASTWLVLGACLLLGPDNPTVGYATRSPVTAWQWLMTQAGVIVHYVKLAVWPTGLRGAYDKAIVVDFADAIVPGLIVLSMLAATIVCWRRRPWLGWLGSLFFLLLAPTSTIMPIVTEVVAERRVYLPMLLPIAVCIVAIDRLAQRTRAFVFPIVIGAAMTALVFVARERVAVHGSKAAFWADAYAKHDPECRSFLAGMIVVNHAAALWESGARDESIARFEEAMRCESPSARGLALYAQAIMHVGRHDEALKLLRELVQTDPEPNTWGALGVCLAVKHVEKRGMPGDPLLLEAEAALRRALPAKPRDLPCWSAFGYVLKTIGRLDEAARAYERLCQLAPDAPEAHLELAKVYAEQRRGAEALAALARAERLAPLDAAMQKLRQDLQRRSGR